MFFVALPKSNLVVHQINPCTAFGNLIRANHLMKIETNLRRTVRHGEMDDGSVFFESAPVALVSKRFAVKDTQRREKPPSADEPSLARGKPHLFDRQQAFIMKNVAVNHSTLGV